MLLSAAQIAGYAQSAGFTGTGLVNAVAVALAESNGDTNARNVNAGGSVDRGVWQINGYWHSEVSDAQAYDPAQAAVAAYRISSGGSDWTPWSTWGNGRYRLFLAQAQQAVAQPGQAAPATTTATSSNSTATVAAIGVLAGLAYLVFG